MRKSLILAALMLPLVLAGYLYSGACHAEGSHAYLKIGAGKHGKWMTERNSSHDDWHGEDNIAAQITLGYRWDVDTMWTDPGDFWVYVEGQHLSQWDRGGISGTEHEDELDGIYLGLEWRFFR